MSAKCSDCGNDASFVCESCGAAMCSKCFIKQTYDNKYIFVCPKCTVPVNEYVVFKVIGGVVAFNAYIHYIAELKKNDCLNNQTILQTAKYIKLAREYREPVKKNLAKIIPIRKYMKTHNNNLPEGVKEDDPLVFYSKLLDDTNIGNLCVNAGLRTDGNIYRLNYSRLPVNDDFYKQYFKNKFRCDVNDCCGFVSNDLVCDSCKTRYCANCWQPLTNNHQCKNDDVATKNWLESNTKPCPECACRIQRIEGCDVMFCTHCHTSFKYNNGGFPYYTCHNIHRAEWLRSIGEEQDKSKGFKLPDVDTFTRFHVHMQENILTKIYSDFRLQKFDKFKLMVREALLITRNMKASIGNHIGIIHSNFRSDVEHILNLDDPDEDEAYVNELACRIANDIKYRQLMNKYQNFIIDTYALLRDFMLSLERYEDTLNSDKLALFRSLLRDEIKYYDLFKTIVDMWYETALEIVKNEEVLNNVDSMDNETVLSLAKLQKRLLSTNKQLYKISQNIGLINYKLTTNEIKESAELRKLGQSAEHITINSCKRIIKDMIGWRNLPDFDILFDDFDKLVVKARSSLRDYCDMFNVANILAPSDMNHILCSYNIWAD